MRRSAWIFFASILLPSLGLAWLAIRSVRDQQVVLEHQQVIISQNITDALAKNIQSQMDQVQGDFVKTTQQLLGEDSSPQNLAQNFNRKLRDAWSMAEIGFAVNLDGEIYSPKPYDGPDARTFRDENDRFLSNRENVEVYSSNLYNINQGASMTQNAASNAMKLPTQAILAEEAQGSSQIMGKVEAQTDQKYRDEDLLKDVAQKRAKDVSHAATLSGGAVRDQQSLKEAQNVSSLDSAASLPQAKPATPTVVSAPVATDELTASTKTEATSTTSSSQSVVTMTRPPPDQSSFNTGNIGTVSHATSTPDGSVSTGGIAATTPTSPAPANLPMSDRARALSSVQAPAPIVVTSTSTQAPSSGPTGAEAETIPVPVAPIVNEMPTSVAGGSSTLNRADQSLGKIQRKVIPQQWIANSGASLSNTVPEESDFRRVIGTETSGELARFLENKMRLMVWSHPAANQPIVFGAQLDQSKLVDALRASFQIPEMAQDSYSRSSGSDICVAILDDMGHPVALSRPDFKGDWKHPFVATEIGEVLPHWEAALYLVDPGQIGRTARTLQFTFGLIVLLLVAAIVSGGSLIAADVRRQVRLAQQKTDFVSNVSHELKTPLTSIRMFADLLAEKRVPDEERQATYLRIIAAEASRLTRLINNVLDFARLERGVGGDVSPGEYRNCDLVDAVRDVVETCGPHLEAAGISFRNEIEAETLPIRGDCDALAQIILNLISNAEKYGGQDVLVRVRRQETGSGPLGCVDVLDRGPGIPARQERTIFEPFHRLDDSLSSGIPGSGLGLTLARRMARAHGGDVTYSARAGGGSCFTLSVPLRVVT